MIRVANLKIDPAAPEYLPECLAREECALPLGMDNDALRVVLGRRDDYREVIDKLQFVLNRRLVCAVADRGRLERAIDEVYTNLATEVSDCPLDFHLECPRRWLELRPTGRADVRSCDSCGREVHLCGDENQALEQTRAGHCVAIFRPVEREPDYSIGFLMFPPVVRDHEPAFRAAFRVVGAPLARDAADGGELSFLETKVIAQDYVDFCDDYVAQKSYPKGRRSEMRRRREAIFPYLGRPLLHGGLSFAGWCFDVFVDQGSGLVIHFEVMREPI